MTQASYIWCPTMRRLHSPSHFIVWNSCFHSSHHSCIPASRSGRGKRKGLLSVGCFPTVAFLRTIIINSRCNNDILESWVTLSYSVISLIPPTSFYHLPCTTGVSTYIDRMYFSQQSCKAGPSKPVSQMGKPRLRGNRLARSTPPPQKTQIPIGLEAPYG